MCESSKDQYMQAKSGVMPYNVLLYCPHLRRTCNVTKASTTLSGSSRHERGPADLSGQSLSESPCALFTAADPLGLVKPTFDQVSSVSRDTIKPFIVVDAMSDVTTKNRRENDGELTIRAGEREVYRSPSSLLGSQESRVHSFTVVHLPPTYSVNLKARHASFICSTYREVDTECRYFAGLV